MQTVAAVVVVLAATLGFWFWRVGMARRAEARVAARLPVGADGVIAGASPIRLGDATAERGALLLHGFGDTPQSLALLATTLHGRGWSVSVPLLPGHGRTLREFAGSRAEAWLETARTEMDALRMSHHRVALVGLSMGGALATILAAESPNLAALALLAPYFEVPRGLRWSLAAELVVTAIYPYLASADARSIKDPAELARSLGYGAATPRLVRELRSIADQARQALPSVRAPTLYVQSRGDNRIASDVAERAYAALGAPQKELVWLQQSGHVITVDYDRELVARLVSDWLNDRVRE